MTLASRRAELTRSTKETEVRVVWNLDGNGVFSIHSGLPFFDHMLAQLSKHSSSDLEVDVKGDVEVDAHHSVEDAGIVLGQVFAEAMGDRRGIRRFASLSLPLDEALVSVSLDISGRPYLEFIASLDDHNPLGSPGFEPQLAEEFFRAFVTGAGITLHVEVVRGKNSHHIVEAIFKCVARCLKQAIQIEDDAMPSTKGTL